MRRNRQSQMDNLQHNHHDETRVAVGVRSDKNNTSSIEPIRYGGAYIFLILFSSIDIILTYLIVIPNRIGLEGFELNPFADRVLQNHGFWGMIVYKFALTVFFIVLCEEVGRRRPKTGKRLAKVAVAIAAIPFVWSLIAIALSP